MKKYVKFQTMKLNLKEREVESRSIRKRIHTLSGLARWEAWQDKRSYGRDTRHILLAYGFARGVPYAACEKKCAEDNQPSATAIIAIVKEHGVEATLDAVKSWLAGEEAGATPVAA